MIAVRIMTAWCLRIDRGDSALAVKMLHLRSAGSDDAVCVHALKRQHFNESRHEYWLLNPLLGRRVRFYKTSLVPVLRNVRSSLKSQCQLRKKNNPY